MGLSVEAAIALLKDILLHSDEAFPKIYALSILDDNDLENRMKQEIGEKKFKNIVKEAIHEAQKEMQEDAK
jgi:hypothetical protein